MRYRPVDLSPFPGLTMTRLVLTQHIAAHVEKVFDLATDLPHAAEHVAAIDRIEMLTEGPVGVGTCWRETRTMFGRESTEEFEITHFDRPTIYTAGGESCGAQFAFAFQFVEIDGGTEVALAVEFKPVTFFAKLMSPLGVFMMGGMKKAVRRDLLDLKQRAEA